MGEAFQAIYVHKSPQANNQIYKYESKSSKYAKPSSFAASKSHFDSY